MINSINDDHCDIPRIYDQGELKLRKKKENLFNSLIRRSTLSDEENYETYHYFIMTRFQQNLEAYFEKHMCPELILNVMLQVLQILQKVHRSSLTYNDLKPCNIMIYTDETSADENALNPKVTLVDFGFAKRYTSSKLGHILRK